MSGTVSIKYVLYVRVGVGAVCLPPFEGAHSALKAHTQQGYRASNALLLLLLLPQCAQRAPTHPKDSVQPFKTWIDLEWTALPVYLVRCTASIYPYAPLGSFLLTSTINRPLRKTVRTLEPETNQPAACLLYTSDAADE